MAAQRKELFMSKPRQWGTNTVRTAKRATLYKRAQATLGGGDIAAAVKLPEGEEEDEWLAMHVVDFYNETALLYSTIVEYCTDECCPAMTAGKKYEYRWANPKVPATHSPHTTPPRPTQQACGARFAHGARPRPQETEVKRAGGGRSHSMGQR